VPPFEQTRIGNSAENTLLKTGHKGTFSHKKKRVYTEELIEKNLIDYTED